MTPKEKQYYMVTIVDIYKLEDEFFAVDARISYYS